MATNKWITSRIKKRCEDDFFKMKKDFEVKGEKNQVLVYEVNDYEKGYYEGMNNCISLIKMADGVGSERDYSPLLKREYLRWKENVFDKSSNQSSNLKGYLDGFESVIYKYQKMRNGDK